MKIIHEPAKIVNNLPHKKFEKSSFLHKFVVQFYVYPSATRKNQWCMIYFKKIFSQIVK